MTSTILKKNKKFFLFLAAWLVASSLAVYLRLYTLRNHTSNDAEDKAAVIVLSSIRRSAAAAVEKNSPGLSEIEKQRAVKQQFDSILRKDGRKVRETIERVSREIEKASPHEKKPFYLMEADSYYYYDLTKNILATGQISDRIRGSKYFNPLMMAPEGYWEPLNLHPFIGAAVYKVIAYFDPGISLMEGLSYTPLVLTVFILFAFFFGCYALDINAGVAFLSSVYLICVPVFLRRSMFGWYKNDPENLLFLFLIPAVLFYGMKCLEKKQKAYWPSLLGGGLLTLYAFFWQGWVFLASMVIASGPLVIAYQYFAPRKTRRTKDLITFYALFAATAFLGVSLAFGVKDLYVVFQEGWTALQDFLNPRLSLWPDLYIAVSELIPPTLPKWMDMLGGPVFVGLGLIGLIFTIIKLFKKLHDPLNPSLIFLFVYLLVTVKMSLAAQRFATLCLVPLAYFFALGAQSVYALIKTSLARTKFQKKSPFYQTALPLFLIVLLSVPPLLKAQARTPEVLNKIYNSTWDAAMTKIKTETPADSIVNAWWPPGHFIKAMASRRVTFDGATINKPQAYWLANAFLANDEREAAGIIRMLNNSANQAAEYLMKEGVPAAEAVDLLKRIAPLDKGKAAAFLKDRLKPEQAQKLLSLTHAAPPPSYILLYNDAVEGLIQFSLVANWDLAKVELINNSPDLRARVPSKGSADYVPFLWKLAGGYPRISELMAPLAQKDGMILFPNNIQIDLATMSCRVDSPKFGKGTPASLFYEKDGNLVEKKFPKPELLYSVLLIREGQNHLCLLADTKIGRSMLMRLYFYGGKGSSLFKPFLDERDMTGRTRVLVYKIDWDKF